MKALLFTLALLAHAEPSTTTTRDDSKPLELPTFSTQADSSSTAKKGMTVSMSCRTLDGTEVKQGEPGYDACLARVNNGARPEDYRHKGAADANSNSANLNFKFGN